MADWNEISSLATGFGTLVLAVATFGSIRSANRAARTAEMSLLANQRPLLLHARDDSPAEHVRWGDGFVAAVSGDAVTVHLDKDSNGIHLACLVRNVGSGIAVLQGWHPQMGAALPTDPEAFRMLERDIYIAPGDTGFLQGAINEPDDRHRDQLETVIREREGFAVDLLYSDPDGGQRMISRFRVVPDVDPEHPAGWVAAVVKHWNIDRDDPRPQEAIRQLLLDRARAAR